MSLDDSWKTAPVHVQHIHQTLFKLLLGRVHEKWVTVVRYGPTGKDCLNDVGWDPLPPPHVLADIPEVKTILVKNSDDRHFILDGVLDLSETPPGRESIVQDAN